MAKAQLQYVRFFIFVVEFIHFQLKELSLISLFLNMPKRTWKSRHWHLGIGIQIYIDCLLDNNSLL